MATASPAYAGNLSTGAMAGVSSVGTAINAYQDRRAAERMQQQQLAQLRDNIAFDQRTRTERIAYDSASQAEQLARERENMQAGKVDQETNIARILASLQSNIAAKEAADARALAASDREVGRQQEYARGQGDAFASSLGQYGAGFNQDMANKSDSLAAVFSDMLARSGPASSAPVAGGPTADYEAAARAVASGDIGGEARNLAAVQAFGQTMADKNIAMGGNKQLDSLIRNFASGSRGALAPELDAANMYFQTSPITTKTPIQTLAQRPSYNGERFVSQKFATPPQSMLGDLFVAGSMAAGQLMQPKSESPYALSQPAGGSAGLRLGGITGGFNTTSPNGLGIRSRSY